MQKIQSVDYIIMKTEWNTNNPETSLYALCEIDNHEYRVLYFDKYAEEWQLLDKMGCARDGYVLRWKRIEDCL